MQPASGYGRSVSLDVSRVHRTVPDQFSSSLYNDSMAEHGDNSGRNVQRQTSEPARNRLRLNNLSDTLASRTSSTKDMVKNTAANFFCVAEDNEEENQRRWQERRMRMLTRKCGKLKPNAMSLRRSSPRTPVICSDGDVTDGADTQLFTAEEDFSDEFHKDPVYKLTLRGINRVSNTLKKRLGKARDEGIKPRPDGLDVVDGGDDDDAFETVDDNFFMPLAKEDLPGDVPDSHNFRALQGRLGPTQLSYIPPQSALLSPAKKPYQNDTWKVRDRKHDDGYIPSSLIETILDNSVRRVYGIGMVGQLLNRQFKKDLSVEERRALDHFDDHRPFFTYWITTVQVLILVFALAAYGFGPFGFGRSQITGLVMVSSLSLQQVDYYEQENFWLGPRMADLVHLGAKFTPCMRRDSLIYEHIVKERVDENKTACCIRNDDSGCVQTTEEQCSPLLSRWHSWSTNYPGPPIRNSRGQSSVTRKSGSVCGQDPRYCEEPPSKHPTEWPDDITKWPICRKAMPVKNVQYTDDRHMSCELIGRPCCIGIEGECRITTQAYCDFVKGHFHEEATLCSQVSCMKDVCGLISFYSDDKPDQFYRLWLSLFLHGGIVHLFLTVLFQFFIVRDIEKLIGWLRTMIIYMLSGIGGNLASAVFVPYRAEVGPAGSQFGMLACLIVEVINSWDLIENPRRALTKLLLIALFLFMLGFLPWIDNFAHFFGFAIGFLLALALLPYLTITNTYKRKTKKVLIVVSLLTVLLVCAGLFVGLYVFPLYKCDWCQYLNCLPFICDADNVHKIAIKVSRL